MKQFNKVLYAAVIQILLPLIRILLRNGIPYGTFADLAKRVYVKVAMEEFNLPERKQSISRVSILTGLSRKEVRRVKELPEIEDEDTVHRYNRAARVISGWIRDSRFTGDDGKPLDLIFEGDDPSFTTLVKLYSGDVPPGAVRDELLRVGVIKTLPEGKIRLLSKAYIPRKGEVEKLNILGTDVKDLISTIDHNILSPPDKVFFQRKVAYDNLPVEILSELRTITEKKGQSLLEDVNQWLSGYDRDVNPDVIGTGRCRAGIGVYYFEEIIEEGIEGRR